MRFLQVSLASMWSASQNLLLWPFFLAFSVGDQTTATACGAAVLLPVIHQFLQISGCQHFSSCPIASPQQSLAGTYLECIKFPKLLLCHSPCLCSVEEHRHNHHSKYMCGIQYTQTHSVVLHNGFSVCYFGLYVKSHGVYLSLYFLVFVM